MKIYKLNTVIYLAVRGTKRATEYNRRNCCELIFLIQSLHYKRNRSRSDTLCPWFLSLHNTLSLSIYCIFALYVQIQLYIRVSVSVYECTTLCVCNTWRLQLQNVVTLIKKQLMRKAEIRIILSHKHRKRKKIHERTKKLVIAAYFRY